MRLALQEARNSFNNDEVPIGAVIVKSDRVIASAGNSVIADGPTKHAEIKVIEQAFESGELDSTCVMYITMEPCIMCYGAIKKSGIEKIVFSTYNDKEGFTKYIDQNKVFYKSGLLADESKKILADFFGGKR